MKKLMILIALIGAFTLSASAQDVTLSQDEAKRVFAALGELKAQREMVEAQAKQIETTRQIIAAQAQVIEEQKRAIAAQEAAIQKLSEMKCSVTSFFWVYKKKRCF